MSEKSINEIYWGLDAKIFTEGSAVNFSGKQEAHFKNSLMESGSAIISWDASRNYQSDKLVPPLPMLTVGKKYRLANDYQSTTADSAFTRLTFFDLQGQAISRQEISEDNAVFTYPQNAYRYQVSIINAGCTALDFRRLQIGDVDLPEGAYDDWWIEKPHNLRRWDSLNLVLMRDNKYQRSTTNEFKALTKTPFQVIHVSWQYDGDFTSDLQHLLWNHHDLMDSRLVSTAQIFDMPIKYIHEDLPQTDIMLSTDYQLDLPKWASPDMTSPDWQSIATEVEKRWERGR